MKIQCKEKVAIHTPDEKTWKYVQEKYTRKYGYCTRHGKETAISLQDGCYGSIHWYNDNGYRIITLEQYEKYGLGDIPVEPKEINNTYDLY